MGCGEGPWGRRGETLAIKKPCGCPSQSGCASPRRSRLECDEGFAWCGGFSSASRSVAVQSPRVHAGQPTASAPASLPCWTAPFAPLCSTSRVHLPCPSSCATDADSTLASVAHRCRCRTHHTATTTATVATPTTRTCAHTRLRAHHPEPPVIGGRRRQGGLLGVVETQTNLSNPEWATVLQNYYDDWANTLVEALHELSPAQNDKTFRPPVFPLTNKEKPR